MKIPAHASATVLALALASAAMLSACAPAPAPVPDDSASTADDAPRTALGRTVDRAMAEARSELATQNIRIGEGLHIKSGSVSARVHKAGNGLPRAEITPEGDLLIAGDPVVVTPEQRGELLQYRAHVLAIAEAGMAMGVKGADLAGQAMGEALRSVFNRDGKDFEQRIEAEARKLESEALELCAHMQPLYDSQQRLAASLPAFAPYATLTQEEVHECGDHDSRDGDRDRIQEQIRSGIRGTIQATVPRTIPEREDAASEADEAAASPEPSP